MRLSIEGINTNHNTDVGLSSDAELFIREPPAFARRTSRAITSQHDLSQLYNYIGRQMNNRHSSSPV
ncbi:hypothetical protein E2C01_097079 [Portunus trituberculatus]|uniref:Uncharacterized protein n=1 Tax=Portunus trituberculatus TaxID=210409 RepID=A0A5B7KA74_PORTR|nr:hypothetical protein [Portunus trituberculatus]